MPYFESCIDNLMRSMDSTEKTLKNNRNLSAILVSKPRRKAGKETVVHATVHKSFESMDDMVVSKTLLATVKKHRQELCDEKRHLDSRLSSLFDDLRNDLTNGEQLLDILPASCSEIDVENSLAKSEYEAKMSIYQNSSTVDECTLSDLYKKLQNLSNRYSYMICINRIRELNQALQIQCELRDFVSVAEKFDQLSSMASRLKTSQCKKLVSYASAVKKLWKTYLKRLICETLEQELKNSAFPSDEMIKNFSEFKSMLRQMIILFHVLKKKKLDDFEEFTDCLVGPLRKRFVYHFADPKKLQGTSGAIKDTTFLKPEWYLSLILKWNEKYSSIFKTLIDEFQESSNDISGENGKKSLREAVSVIRIEFARGLVVLARERFKFDLTLVLTSEIFACDDKAFPHLIDEAVAFDIEMRENGYPESEVGCIELLTESGIFERWFELEQQQCTRCMEGLLADESAWTIRYSEVFDLDRFKFQLICTKLENGTVTVLQFYDALPAQLETNNLSQGVPRCIDNFFSLLTALTHRYKLLRSRQHRQQFVRLQRNLIDDYRMHLFQMTRLSSSAWSTPFPQIINATSYIRRVLSYWQELPFFLDLEAGVFDELIDLFAHFNSQMLSDTKEAVLEQSKHLIASYVKEINDSVTFNDNSIAVILVPLQAKLLEVKDLLSEANFREWFRSFVEGFEGLLIRNVILEIRIDAKLGNELQNHLAFVLPRLFHSFGLPNSIYLQKLYQYLTVCSLNAASCILLKAALQDQSESVVDNVLAEMNLTSLTRNELEALLQRRSDITV